LKKKYGLGNVLETPFNTELGPLVTQEAEVALVIEPNTTYALQNGARVLVDFTKPAALTAFFTIKKNAKTQKKELQKLLTAIRAQIPLDQDRAIRIAEKYFPGSDEAILRTAIKNICESDSYCPRLQFTKEELEYGLLLRGFVELKSKVNYLQR